jgi:hypothetical protein
MLFLQISKHAPESCPLNNERAMKINKSVNANLEKLLKKHGVKMVGGWHDPTNHRFVMVFDASFEALMKLSMEPELVAWGALHNSEMFPVLTLDEAAKLYMK